MQSALSVDESRLALWLKLCAPLYLVAGILFVLLQQQMFVWLEPITSLAGLQPTPVPVEKFWLALSFSMMLMLSICCWLGSRDVRRNVDMAVPVFASKFASTLLGLLFFITHAPYGMYVVIAITDLPLGIVTLWLWRNARRSTG